MTKVGIKEFSKNIDKYADLIEQGEVFEVVKKSRTLFTTNGSSTDSDVKGWTNNYIRKNRQLLESLKDK